MLPSRKSWSFTILFYWDFAESWSQRQNVGVKCSKFGVNENSVFTSNIQFGYPCPRGGGQAVQAGLSCPPPPPPQDLGQTVSSVNSYCTIILEYLVVRDVNIISDKLWCLHLTFSLVILVRRVGASCQGWFILPPAQDLGETVSSVNSYCTIILEYLVVRDVNIISDKLRWLHLTFSSVILVRGVGGKLSRLVYLAPPPHTQDLGQTVSSVNFYCTIILEYLVVRDVNIISDSQTEMFISNDQFGYPCLRGRERAVQAGLSCPPPRIWVKQCHQLTLMAP